MFSQRSPADSKTYVKVKKGVWTLDFGHDIQECPWIIARWLFRDRFQFGHKNLAIVFMLIDRDPVKDLSVPEQNIAGLGDVRLVADSVAAQMQNCSIEGQRCGQFLCNLCMCVLGTGSFDN